MKKAGLAAIVAVPIVAIGGYFGISGGDAVEPAPTVQDTPLICNGPIDVNILEIEIHTPNTDAVEINENCTGYISNLIIHTWTNDGIKIKNRAPVAHDLIFDNVIIVCEDSQDGAHQDGVQVMGGHNIHFYNLIVRCGLSNSNFFVSNEAATDILCIGCNFGPGASHTVNVWASTNPLLTKNGVVDSVLCKPDTKRYYTKHGPVIDSGNRLALIGDPECEPL